MIRGKELEFIIDAYKEIFAKTGMIPSVTEISDAIKENSDYCLSYDEIEEMLIREKIECVSYHNVINSAQFEVEIFSLNTKNAWY